MSTANANPWEAMFPEAQPWERYGYYGSRLGFTTKALTASLPEPTPSNPNILVIRRSEIEASLSAMGLIAGGGGWRANYMPHNAMEDRFILFQLEFNNAEEFIFYHMEALGFQTTREAVAAHVAKVSRLLPILLNNMYAGPYLEQHIINLYDIGFYPSEIYDKLLASGVSRYGLEEVRAVISIGRNLSHHSIPDNKPWTEDVAHFVYHAFRSRISVDSIRFSLRIAGYECGSLDKIGIFLGQQGFSVEQIRDQFGITTLLPT